jgi:NhaP-type Na+/H+ or K+/H+ antiporter
MITWIELGAVLAFTLAATLTVTRIMWRPLHDVLLLVCGEPAAARFWTTFASVMLVCGPLFLVCFAAGRSANLAELLRQAVYLCSLGLIGAFIAMGVAVGLAVQPRHPALMRASAPATPAAE